MRIVFDLDGVICQTKQNESDNYYLLHPYPEAEQSLRDLKSAGHYVILHTARHMKTCHGNVSTIEETYYLDIIDWLNKWGIPFDELHIGKPYADAYVDDRAIHHSDWPTTLHKLKSLEEKSYDYGNNLTA